MNYQIVSSSLLLLFIVSASANVFGDSLKSIERKLSSWRFSPEEKEQTKTLLPTVYPRIEQAYLLSKESFENLFVEIKAATGNAQKDLIAKFAKLLDSNLTKTHQDDGEVNQKNVSKNNDDDNTADMDSTTDSSSDENESSNGPDDKKAAELLVANSIQLLLEVPDGSKEEPLTDEIGAAVVALQKA